MGSLLKSAPLLLVLLLALLGIGWQEEKWSRVEDRPLPFPPQQRYSKIFATLGVVCKCCDGAAASSSGENCVTSWAGSCSNLQCLPWKLQK